MERTGSTTTRDPKCDCGQSYDQKIINIMLFCCVSNSYFEIVNVGIYIPRPTLFFVLSICTLWKDNKLLLTSLRFCDKIIDEDQAMNWGKFIYSSSHVKGYI